jgi:hypothetical protein
MDPDDIKLINDIYIKVLKKGKQLYNNDDNSTSNAKYLESYAMNLGEMNEKLESIVLLTDKYATECLNKAIEIREFANLYEKYKDDKYPVLAVTKEMNKNLKWGDSMELEHKKQIILDDVDKLISKKISKNEYDHKKIMYKTIKDIYSTKLNFDWKLPIVNKLNDIPTSLYWYKGDKTHPKGVYTSLSTGFYVQVPLPNVIDGTKDFNRVCSTKCKYNTVDACLLVRQSLSTRFNTNIRSCNFAHTGDKYSKIGSLFRCPNLPRFGNHTYINTDIDVLPDYDIRMLLMYSLSDIMLSSMWFQKQKTSKLFLTNLDIC